MKLEGITTEVLLTHPDLFGLTTASSVQRAFCRAIDGLPLGEELACDPDVIVAFGGADAIAMLPDMPPVEVDLLAAIRSGKSLLAAVALFRATQRVDVSGLSRGDVPRVTLISLRTDLAEPVYQHLMGGLRGSPILRRLLIGEPKADSVLIRHPSGCAIEVKIAAGAAAGSATISRWSAGVVVDEAPRMSSAEAGKIINYDETRRYALGRLLPNAQFISIGSPWVKWGPSYERAMANHGKPSRDLLIVRATGPQMNPVWWTPERVDDLRRRDLQAYKTDVLGEFADAESGAFEPDHVDRGFNLKIPPMNVALGTPIIVADPSKGGAHDEFAFVPVRWILPTSVTYRMSKKYSGNNLWFYDYDLDKSGAQIALEPHQIFKPRLHIGQIHNIKGRPGRAVEADEAVARIAQLARAVGASMVVSDQYESYSLGALIRQKGLKFVSINWAGRNGPSSKHTFVEHAKGLMRDQRMSFDADPLLRSQLLSYERKVSASGNFQYGNSRHDDRAALVLTACAADLNGLIGNSPFAHYVYRDYKNLPIP